MVLGSLWVLLLVTGCWGELVLVLSQSALLVAVFGRAFRLSQSLRVVQDLCYLEW